MEPKKKTTKKARVTVSSGNKTEKTELGEPAVQGKPKGRPRKIRDEDSSSTGLPEVPSVSASFTEKTAGRNQQIINAKVRENEPVADIAARYNLSTGAVYSILRQARVDTRKKPVPCSDCTAEHKREEIPFSNIKNAIACGQCLKHYQRGWRRRNKPRITERDYDVVPLFDENGNIIGETSVRAKRLAAHREAQRRYCEKHPERVKGITQRYRVSDLGKQANRRAVHKYRERLRQDKITDMLQRYRPKPLPEKEKETSVSLA